MSRSASILLAFLTVCAPALADRLDDVLREQMERRRIPGLALAVLKDAEVVSVRTYGMANLETETPVSPDSVFELASLTKPFTAAAILELVEAGKVGLDDPVAGYLEDPPAAWAAITVRQLLSHTSGLPEEAIGVCDGLPLMDVPAGYLEGLIRTMPLLFAPGTDASYSDPGYFLLGRVIEKASGASYADHLEQTFFGPLGMKTAHVQDLRRIVQGRVAPYALREGRLLRGRRDWQLELNSQFGIWASLMDLVRWERALAAGTLLEPASLGRMWAPARTSEGRVARVWGVPYGFGWMVGDYAGERLVEHGGFSGTHMVRFLDRGWTVIVLTNLDIASGSDPRLLSREAIGFFAADLRLPWRLEPQDDPSPVRTEALRQAFVGLAEGRRTPSVTDRWWEEWEHLPPPIRERLQQRYGELGTLRFVSCSAASPRMAEEEGVVQVCHFASEGPAGSRYYSLSLDAQDRVLAAPSWVP